MKQLAFLTLLLTVFFIGCGGNSAESEEGEETAIVSPVYPTDTLTEAKVL